MEKLERCLVSWKGRILFKGGKVILINNVLSNLLVYYMSFFCMPKTVVSKLEKLRRNFLWNSFNNGRKLN